MALTIGRFDSSDAASSEIIVGIDLGTTNSLVAISENRKPRVLKDGQGASLVPSVIHWNDKLKKALIGKEARKLRITDAAHTAYSVKRFMGRGRLDLNKEQLSSLDTTHSTDQNILVKLGEKTFSAVELSSQILKELKNLAEKSLKQKVSKAVITVPAYFNDSQRSATRLAGQLAGLEVVRIVNEPTAAALAYGLDRNKNGIIAVYDLGGGTFDTSILKLHDGIFEVLATHGDTVLGGDDFDNALTTLIAKQIPDSKSFEGIIQWKATLIEAAENIKIILSEKTETDYKINFQDKVYSIKISRSDFETSIKNLIEKTIEITESAIQDSGVQKKDIDDIVMVGGSTRIPLVRQTVRDFFGKDLNVSLNPDEVVALGAAVQADILSGNNDDMVLLDVVPLSLGIETYGGAIGKLIHRNSKVPCMAQETFTTHVDGQRNVLIHVLQGERELAKDCRSLAQFNLKGLPPMPAGLPKIQVTFLVDANGLLIVRAKEITTGLEAAIDVKPAYGLNDDEVEKILTASFDHAKEDMQARQLVDTKVEAEGILRSAEKILNDAALAQITENVNETKEVMKSIRNLMKSDDYIAIRTALDKLEEVAKPIAEQVMNQALKGNLTHKNINDIVGPKKES